MTIRRKAAIITTLAALCWTPFIGAAAWFL